MGKNKRKSQFPKGKPPQPTPSPRAASGNPASSTPASDPEPRISLFDSLPRPQLPDLIPMDKARRVPMEFRAQATGRCQRQLVRKRDDSDPEDWCLDSERFVKEWTSSADERDRFTVTGLRISTVQIDWRLVSNSGVDEGFIRPVVGNGGWPMIPGSSIKGLFRRACVQHADREALLRWCGSSDPDSPSPGILRFHGGWPADTKWKEGLLDLTHPQQGWQVGFGKGREGHNANAIVSLYQPRLVIGLSSSDTSISEGEWQEVEAILRRALGRGIGGRTCVGYGSCGWASGEPIFECSLEGQGQASKLLDDSTEFRPTMFRAAIRGMALRLFGGLSDEAISQEVVGRLFGSLGQRGRPQVGLLATAYVDSITRPGSFGKDRWNVPTYATQGRLQWRLNRARRQEENEALLIELLAALHGLMMSLGGFGKGWRRPDHRIFLSNYYKQQKPKPLIGCHWQWREVAQLPPWIHVQSAADLAALLQRSRELASRWLEMIDLRHGSPARWREVIHPQKLQLWTRWAEDPDEAVAIDWFHRELKGTSLGGKINQVSRIWNRLLPITDDQGLDAQVSNNPHAAPTARPAANPFERPSALARPSAMSRPGSPKQSATAKRDVSIEVHPGPFLETLVLFPEMSQSPAFAQKMNQGEGADAGFRPVRF
jgi:CRISPR-associated protein Cmr6